MQFRRTLGSNEKTQSGATSDGRRLSRIAIVLSALAIVLTPTSAALAVAYITGADVVDESLTGVDVQNGSLGASELGDAAVGTRNLADLAVSRSKLRIQRGAISVGNAGTRLNVGSCVLITTPVPRSDERDVVVPQGLDYSQSGSVSYLNSAFVLNARNQDATRSYYELCATQTGATVPSGLRFKYAVLAG